MIVSRVFCSVLAYLSIYTLCFSPILGVINTWLDTLLDFIEFLPVDCLEREVIIIIFILLQLNSNTMDVPRFYLLQLKEVIYQSQNHHA